MISQKLDEIEEIIAKTKVKKEGKNQKLTGKDTRILENFIPRAKKKLKKIKIIAKKIESAFGDEKKCLEEELEILNRTKKLFGKVVPVLKIQKNSLKK